MSFSFTYSRALARQRARLACFGVCCVEVFNRQLCRQKLIIPGHHLINKSFPFRKSASTTVRSNYPKILCKILLILFVNKPHLSQVFCWGNLFPVVLPVNSSSSDTLYPRSGIQRRNFCSFCMIIDKKFTFCSSCTYVPGRKK